MRTIDDVKLDGLLDVATYAGAALRQPGRRA
jgi:hypothetical protein